MASLDVDRLEALGFFRYEREAEQPEAPVLARGSRFAFAGAGRRFYHADAESLAEHGVRDFLGSVAPFLRRQGVPIEVTYERVKVAARDGRPACWAVAALNADGWLDDDGPLPRVDSMKLSPAPGAPMCEVTEDDLETSETYLLQLGDREITIYDFEPGAEWDGWGAATRATLAILNELLTAYSSAERAYAYSSDNSLSIAFVTPEMARIINEAAEPRERLHDGSLR